MTDKPARPCFVCGSENWWEISPGSFVCGICHPKPGVGAIKQATRSKSGALTPQGKGIVLPPAMLHKSAEVLLHKNYAGCLTC